MADAGLLDDTQSEETTFIPDDISAIIKEARAPSPPTAHAPWLARNECFDCSAIRAAMEAHAAAPPCAGH
jgi:hypothetical protein